jgi:hypothetical protein
MIVMHSGITPIPEGWAICDGNEYTYNGKNQAFNVSYNGVNVEFSQGSRGDSVFVVNHVAALRASSDNAYHI